MTEERYGDYRDKLTEEDIQRAGDYLGDIISIEKSEKVNESQIDFLKPCPFCGSTSIRVECWQNRNREKDYWITCENCDATSGVRDNRTSVIELWNRRSGE